MAIDLKAPAYPFGKDRIYPAGKDVSLKAAMDAVAALRGSSGDPDGVLSLALDWLHTLRIRLEKADAAMSAVRLVEFVSSVADSDGNPVPGTEAPRILAYNTAVISDAEATELLDTGRYELDGRVIVMWPSEAKILFPDMHEVKEDDQP